MIFQLTDFTIKIKKIISYDLNCQQQYAINIIQYMQLCQLEQNGHLIRSSSIRHPSSGKPAGLSSYVTHAMPIGSLSKASTNHYGISQISINPGITNKDSFSRSLYIKPEGGDMENFMKEVKQKIAVMGRVLSEHQLKIADLEGKKVGYGSYNKENQRQISQMVKKSGLFEQKSRGFEGRIISQIEKLRQEINKPVRNVGAAQTPKIAANLQQNFKLIQSQLLGRIKQLKEKTYAQFKSMNQSFRKQLQHQIHNIQDINTSVFNKIEKDMMQLEKRITSGFQENSSKYKSGKQRYLGVLQMIKFKEVVERQNNKDKQNEHQREEVVVHEGTYFLDKDGYLLDKEGYYITGDDDKWIQLSSKQIKILRAYNILQE